MSEEIGCCSNHLECQLTGICNKDYNCMLYHSTIKYMFKALIILKKKDLVEIESNHLTSKGINYLLKNTESLTKVIYLLWIIFVLGADNTSRINPKIIEDKWRYIVDNISSK